MFAILKITQRIKRIDSLTPQEITLMPRNVIIRIRDQNPLKTTPTIVIPQPITVAEKTTNVTRTQATETLTPIEHRTKNQTPIVHVHIISESIYRLKTQAHHHPEKALHLVLEGVDKSIKGKFCDLVCPKAFRRIFFLEW